MQELKTDNIQSPTQDPAVSAKQVLKPMADNSNGGKINWTAKTIALLLVLLVLGIASGYAVYAKKTSGTLFLGGKDVELVKTPTEEGVKDAATFRDTASGILKENDGKVTDEGSHVLIRGDVSQNVYLTSSVVDLSKYAGKKVQIWGETFEGRKAGWLMDVGRIKLL